MTVWEGAEIFDNMTFPVNVLPTIARAFVYPSCKALTIQYDSTRLLWVVHPPSRNIDRLSAYLLRKRVRRSGAELTHVRRQSLVDSRSVQHCHCRRNVARTAESFRTHLTRTSFMGAPNQSRFGLKKKAGIMRFARDYVVGLRAFPCMGQREGIHF